MVPWARLFTLEVFLRPLLLLLLPGIIIWVSKFSAYCFYLGWSWVGSNQTKKNAGAYGSTWWGKQSPFCRDVKFLHNSIAACFLCFDIDALSYSLIYRGLNKMLNSRVLRKMPRGLFFNPVVGLWHYATNALSVLGFLL